MDHFYTTPSLVSPDGLVVDGEEFSHLTHVMRKRIGDVIIVVDGLGNAYDCTITEITKRSARCSIHTHHHNLHEPQVELTLAVAILKNASKFDFLVEKTTELGVRHIVPLRSNRTIPEHSKSERWQKLALSAMKQSGRSILPQVAELTDFEQFLEQRPGDLNLIAHEKVESPQMSELVRGRRYRSIAACIGPEGGFTEQEIHTAMTRGFVAVGLGPRRLRTETAAIAAATLLLHAHS